MLPATSEFFHKKSRNSDGCQPNCKKCTKAYQKRWYEDNTERKAETSREWREANPERHAENGRRWQTENRERKEETNREWYVANRERAKENARKWREAHPELVRGYSRKWCESHPEKARARNAAYRAANAEKLRVSDAAKNHRRRTAEGSFTPEEVETLLESQWYECAYCGADLLETSYHLDHKVPVSKGGTSYIENIAAACPACNMSKGAKDLDEWLSERKVPMCLT